MPGSHTIASGFTTTVGYTITSGDGANYALTVDGEAKGGSSLDGVLADAATPTIVNNNKIIANTALANSQAAHLVSGGRITNNAAGLMSANSGVYIGGTAGTVVNYGGISGASAVGVTLNAGGSILNGGIANTAARVPAKYLINGSTVVQVRRARVTYYHVELPEHDVILAEDLPVESYLDAANRSNFADQDSVRLFPDFAREPVGRVLLEWEAHGAAPLVMAGPMLRDARAVLAANIAARTVTSC